MPQSWQQAPWWSSATITLCRQNARLI